MRRNEKKRKITVSKRRRISQCVLPVVTACAGVPGVADAFTYTTANTFDLSPTNISGYSQSILESVAGGQQAGIAVKSPALHAMIWSSTSNTAVDLNPTNLSFANSAILSTNGVQQVGYGYAGSTDSHALLWSGTSTALDLNPINLSGFSYSRATALNGNQQVGFGFGTATGGTNIYHALLWSGAANTAVDLNPVNLTG